MIGGATNSNSVIIASEPLTSDISTWIEVPEYSVVYVKGEGIICNEPSVVAVQKDGRGGRRVLAVGAEAKKMVATGVAPSELYAKLMADAKAKVED